MRERHVVEPEVLAARARELLPPCMLRHALGEAADVSEARLQRYFSRLTNVPDFGERLVHLAGLSIHALYLDAALTRRAGFVRDPVLDDYVRTLLFDRGADLGLACATVQRVGVLQGNPVADLVQDDRPVTSFVVARPTSTGNFLRGQLDNPVENQLLELLQNLRFLGDFTFDASGEVQFQRSALDCAPFLHWDGQDLWRFGSLHRTGDAVVAWRRPDVDLDRQQSLPVDSALMARLRLIATLLGVSKEVFDGSVSVDDEGLPRSIMPLFAESYPAMNRLATQIWHKATFETKVALWAGPAFPARVEAERAATNEVFITNAIIKQCMERDPVTVLEKYFALEHGDQGEYLEWLIPSREKAQEVLHTIHEAADGYRKKLSAFYCRPEDKELRQKVHDYQARLAAIKVVELLGFPVIQEAEIEDVENLRRRLMAFRDYLDDNSDRREDAALRTRAGLLDCCRCFENLLTTLVLFYEAVKLFDLGRATGLDEQSNAAFDEIRKARIQRKGLGTLIYVLRDLGRDHALKQKLRQVGGRDALWPDGSADVHLAALNDLNLWRLPNVHDTSVASNSEPADLVKRLLAVVDWLIYPGGRDVPREWRIFPAHLSLNLVTTNSCGITSVRYSLRRHDTQTDITLYTKQPLTVSNGSLLGVPKLGKAMDGLWVDPILVPASVARPQ